MNGIKANAIWSLLGIPFALLSLFHYLKKRKVKVDLKNKVVFITGASSGLGEACAQSFHDAGCKVILSGRSQSRLSAVQDRLAKRENSNVNVPAIVVMDLEDLKTISSKVAEAISKFGHIDIVINNAGMSSRGTIHETRLEVDQKLMTVNYFGHVEVMRALLPHMMARKSGHAVAVSSVQGRISLPFRASYAASKHALHAYFDCLRAEMASYNIDVSVIIPTYIRTNLSSNAMKGDGSLNAQTDKNTLTGLDPDYVSSQIVQCVVHREEEVTLAPLHVQLAMGLRALAPWLYFKIMASRAVKESKKDS